MRGAVSMVLCCALASACTGSRPAPPRPGVFDIRTDTVLVFDDGGDGVVAIDLDERRAVRRPIGGSAGDQPFRLWRSGDKLISGWGDISAFDLRDGSTRRIAEATIFVPAGEADRIWLAEWEGGRVGMGTLSISLVDAEGGVHLGSRALPDVGYPAVGVGGDLVFQQPDSSIEVWDVRGAKLVRRLHEGTVQEARGTRLVWMDAEGVFIDDLSDETPAAMVHSEAGRPNAASLSPDSRWLALTTPAGDANDEEQVTLISVADGRRVQAGPPLARLQHMTWSPDSRRLFVSNHSWGEDSTALGFYDVEAQAWHSTTLPIGSLLRPLVTSRRDADMLITHLVDDDGDCPAPLSWPSRRENGCAVTF